MEDLIHWSDSSWGVNLSDGPENLVLFDELLTEVDWSEPSNCFAFLQPSTSSSSSPLDCLSLPPLTEISNNPLNPIPQEPSDEIQIENLEESPLFNPNGASTESIQPIALNTMHSNSDTGANHCMQPGQPLSSITERFILALRYIKECHRDGEVLVQIWVPVRRGDQQVLTTRGQPFELDANSERLVNYRTISTNYCFSAEESSSETVGLPGRVFLERLPEWSPDVRYFNSYEYARVDHAQRYDVRATLALPVFERGSRSCLGVVEIVMTAEKIQYTSDLEEISNALQEVDLTSSEIMSVPHVTVRNDSYQAALPEILEVLRTVCLTHRLPLAQAWILCSQQVKRGCRHSEENYKDCISTVDVACYVNNLSMLGFHEACSEHHLLRGQGVAGQAFTTNQPCFSPDVTSFSKTEYPMSHHARIFGLRAAVAIRLRSIHLGTADFVLEFFFPIDCMAGGEQKSMLDSLSVTLQNVCRSLRVVTAKELEDEPLLQVTEMIPSTTLLSEKSVGSHQLQVSERASYRTASTPEDQQKAEGTLVKACAGLEFKEQHHQYSVGDNSHHNGSFTGETGSSEIKKNREIQSAKSGKTVTLQVLRQHFSGSMKDAAKSLGVCPTTLKRICRQQGISSWPSRKIKKVDHSLKKLQVVIDSVQDAAGAFPLSSLYASLVKDSVSDKKVSGNRDFSNMNQKGHSDSPNDFQEQEGGSSKHASAVNSLPPSSCSRSSSASLGCSNGTKRRHTHSVQLEIEKETPKEENQIGLHKRLCRKVELLNSANEEPESLKGLGKHPSPGSLSSLGKSNYGWLFRVKAIYGEEKVRFRLQPTWGFHDLKQEIAKRFPLSNRSPTHLRYLDDDSEWVLLTCNADLQECIDVCKSSHTDTIRISVRHVHPTAMGGSSSNNTGSS